MTRRITAPTGSQFRLTHDDQTAVITEIGASLRSYAVAGAELLDTHDEFDPCGDARGQILLPWPNRLADGRWSSPNYSPQQLDLTEPEL